MPAQANMRRMAGQWACIMADMPETNIPESVDPNRLKITNDDASKGPLGGTLIGFRCQECGASVFGPAIFCQACTSTELEPVDLGSKGFLYSFTIVRIPPAGWPGPVPYVLGQVELPLGPQVLAEVIDCEHDDLKIGMAVEMKLQAVPAENGGSDKAVYKWRPA
ncbi:MAG: Zn-ribbon domain-containing OB-fold protein [Chloroflexi bacterium]|nr:Zn-ribbon domain-containing OB-fold protein [Chloroflexota bacterium]